MKTDKNGRSTCKPGKENYETFPRIVRRAGKKVEIIYYQYEYRAVNGALFTCVKQTLKECREERLAWLEEQGVLIS